MTISPFQTARGTSLQIFDKAKFKWLNELLFLFFVDKYCRCLFMAWGKVIVF